MKISAQSSYLKSDLQNFGGTAGSPSRPIERMRRAFFATDRRGEIKDEVFFF
jgi:hypothetical protein